MTENTEQPEFPERFTDGNGLLELTEDVKDAITVRSLDEPYTHSATHEPTDTREEYTVSEFARGMNPNALRDVARRQLARDHPEILDHHVGEDPEVVTDGGRVKSGITMTMTDEDAPEDADGLTTEFLERFMELNPMWELETATFRLYGDPDTVDGEQDPEPEREVRTDGGSDSREMVPVSGWELKARENTEKWGLQPVDALLLAMGEEMGELAAEVHSFADYPDADGMEAVKAEQGRDLIRRMDDLGRDIREFLESVSERDGEPIPEDERPTYLNPFPEDLKRSRRERLIRSELDDLMALGYQFLWALDGAREDPEVRTDGGRNVPPEDVREWAAESLYHGQYRCECGYTEDLSDDMDVNDVIELHNEHVREEHGGEDSG